LGGVYEIVVGADKSAVIGINLRNNRGENMMELRGTARLRAKFGHNSSLYHEKSPRPISVYKTPEKNTVTYSFRK